MADRIAVGADHGGFRLKAALVRRLAAAGYAVEDMGTHSQAPCDYPRIGARVARAVAEGRAKRGLLLCRSGAGMAIVANKFPRVRAAVCESTASARHCREHNDANILVLGADRLSARKAGAVLSAWLEAPFAGGRHARRLRQIRTIEKEIQSECSST